jgi:hypothetical protein
MNTKTKALVELLLKTMASTYNAEAATDPIKQDASSSLI